MTNKNSLVQEQLALIKEDILRLATRYEFSDYIEYFCAKKIGDFTDIEIERAYEDPKTTLKPVALS